MPPLISVVVVNWNGRAYLERCLASLRAQTCPDVEIILVDNGSHDGSPDWAAQNFPAVRLIRNPDNRGFAAANNQGLQAATGEYVALLNNDAWVEPDWLERLWSALQAGPRLGMAASQMVFADRPEVVNSLGIGLDRCGMSWDLGGGQAALPAAAPVRPVFGPCAGAALYRRALFDDVGLFDETFFAYLEDVDLAWRARWRGWEAVCVPAARVWHIHSGTAGEGSAFKTRLLARNKIYLLARNYPWPQLALYLPLIIFYEVLSLAYALGRGRGGSALRGRWDGLRLVPQAVRERTRLGGARRPSGEILRLLAPAPAPWQVYRRYRHIERYQE